MTTLHVLWVSVVACLSISGCGIGGVVPVPPARAACDALAGKGIASAHIVSSQFIAANATSPEYCKATAHIDPQLNFEVRLPSKWNGKMHYSGGGGFDGSISPVDMRAVALGFADVASDSGHSGGLLDASFAFNDPLALDLFGLLSVPTVATATKEIIKQRYGTEPSRSYFQGCSTGGREGLSVALHFPTMFDGVIAGAPARQYASTYAHTQRWMRLLNSPGGSINARKLTLLSNAVLAACDAADGLADGIVSNTQACNFSPAVLRCAGGGDTGDSCLSDAQIRVLDALTSQTTLANGALTYPGFNFSGLEAQQWSIWMFHPPSIHLLFANTAVKNLLAKNVNADVASYDFDANAGALQALSSIIDVTESNLTSFASVGGKIMMYQGWGDPAVAPQQTTGYYNGIVTASGGQARAAAFVRYYILPGVSHCGGGTGADDVGDMLPALDKWVTAGIVPDSMAARKTDPASGSTILSRPLCAYPNYARYSRGSPERSESFVCVSPTSDR